MNKQEFFNKGKKKFFFDDAFKIGEYAKENFPEQAQYIIIAADRVVEDCFIFDLPHEMERTTEPVIFDDGQTDWLYQPGDDPEWIYAFNRMVFWITLGKAYAITRDERYARTFVRQCTHWIKNVKRDDPANAPAWRSIEAGLRLEYWQKAMQYFKDSAEITDEFVELFYGSVVEHAEFIMGIWNDYNLMSNWGVLANHGLFIAGVMLPDSTRSMKYIDEAKRRLALEAEMQVFRDGTHWEQSPMYHNEVLHDFLDVLILAQRNDIELSPLLYQRVKAMCVNTMHHHKPDHNEIAFGDSDEMDFRDLLSKGAVVFAEPKFKFGGHAKGDMECVFDLGEIGLAQLEELGAIKPDATDMAFPDSGSFYFRSGWGELDTFLHFYCGTLGAGHSHADKLHLDIFSRGEDVLIDAGRYTYVFGEERRYFKSQRMHNTLMVDGEELYVCKDSWLSERLTRGVNQKFYSDEKYGYSEAGHLGYIDKGVYLNRRIIYLKPDIIVVADELYGGGDAAHVYNQFFRFDNKGKLSGSGDKYVYHSAKVRADIHFISAGLKTSIDNTYISRLYNQKEPSKGIVTELEAKGFASIYTVIALSDGDEQRCSLHVKKNKVESSFKGITFGDDCIEALDITDKRNGRDYTLVVAHKEFACPTDTFRTSGCVGYGHAVVFDRAAGEHQIGTVLVY